MRTRMARACCCTVIALAAAVVVMAPLTASAAFVTFEAGGDATAASIQPTVDAFRAALGDPNNGNAPGPLPDGRREINWDGGGAVVISPAGTPFAGFQNTRGALFSTPGTGFAQVPVDLVDDLFSNPTYVGEFSAFSPVRLFTPIESNVTDVTFFIPGTAGAQAATVTGFGAVFTDVDVAGSTQLLFFDTSDQVIFSEFVAEGTVPAGSLSFLGAVADAGERIARVRIIAGAVAPGPDDSLTADVVLMDDFLYAEPQAVPEPGLVLLMIAAGSAVIVTRVRRRRT